MRRKLLYASAATRGFNNLYVCVHATGTVYEYYISHGLVSESVTVYPGLKLDRDSLGDHHT